MNTLLSFVNPLEFIFRYTVLVGIVLAMFGVALCILAKPITLKKRGTDELDKKDRVYSGLLIAGLCLVLVGMICIALPIEGTFYKI